MMHRQFALWSGWGPYKIVNNYLEGAGENFMAGGSDTAYPELCSIRYRVPEQLLLQTVVHGGTRMIQATAGIDWVIKNII